MALKIAAVDKPWLQQMVLQERKRLASLHRAALLQANTDTAIADHKDDVGYAPALAEQISAPKDVSKAKSAKVAAFPGPDAPGIEDAHLEVMNQAQVEMEDRYPDLDAQDITDLLTMHWTPGDSVDSLIARITTAPDEEEPIDDLAALAGELSGHMQVASVKKASELNVNEAGDPPNTTRATQDHAYELEQLAKQISAMVGGKTEWDPNDMQKD